MINDPQPHISGLIPVPSAVLRTDTNLSTDSKVRHKPHTDGYFPQFLCLSTDGMMRQRHISFDIPHVTSSLIRILPYNI
jgi:hypothetical protein